MTDQLVKGLIFSKKSLKHIHKELKYWVKITCAVTVLVMVIGNIIASQTVSPLYYKVINEQPGATVTFLKIIKPLPEYAALLTLNTSLYGRSIEDEIIAPKLEREQLIHQLEESLKRNNEARDVLYSLHVLYRENGAVHKAESYLQRARAVDPDVGKK
ncbi:MAG: hypothetical protein RI947_1283 [Candidatus Parcubacteria bacterium]|jgi:tetratricopeptide (TPR) repeat protein